jgi:hypothetical protein
MIRLLMCCVVLLTSLAFPTISSPREFAVRAQCFDDTFARPTVAVLELLDIASGTRTLSGVVNFADGDQLHKTPLRFREAGVNAIWQGEGFLLRVHTNNLSSTDQFVGRFRGRDDDGNPVVLPNLLCDLFLPLP